MLKFLIQSENGEAIEQLIVPDSVQKARFVEVIKNLADLDAHSILHDIVSWLVWTGIKVCIALAIYYVGRWLLNRLLRMVDRIMTRRGTEVSLHTFLLTLIRTCGYIVLVVVIVSVLGVDSASFVAILASMGLAIGMALSGTLQNFAGGVMILVLRPYKVGDYIEAQGVKGTVQAIRLFTTTITTTDKQTIYIPNNMISSGIIKNYSQEPMRRVDWNITISYGDDVAVARRALLAIMQSDPRVKSDPAPTVYLTSLGDSAVNVSARGWVDTADYWSTFFDLNERIYRELPGYGINFPFPQLQVHFDTDERPAPAKGADVPERPSTAASDSVKR